MRQAISAFVAAFVFALGLGISGMTNANKVFSFLNLAGQWDPSLAFVMVGAIASHLAFYRFIIKRPSPIYDGVFHIPSNTHIDAALIAGSALFGIGWALGGFCPGPALVSLLSGKKEVLLFTLFMVAGMLLSHVLRAKKRSARAAEDPASA